MKGATVEEIFAAFGSQKSGLSHDEAAAKLVRNGPNSLPANAKSGFGVKFAAQFTHFFALLLWTAAAISFAAALLDPASNMMPIAWAILIVIILNGIFGFYQEFRTEKSLEALRRILPSKALVRREGGRVCGIRRRAC